MVERSGVVGGDAAGEDVALPGAGGDFKALQLAQRLLQAVLAAQSWSRARGAASAAANA